MNEHLCLERFFSIDVHCESQSFILFYFCFHCMIMVRFPLLLLFENMHEVGSGGVGLVGVLIPVSVVIFTGIEEEQQPQQLWKLRAEIS